MSPIQNHPSVDVDAAIVGGGIAGAWLFRSLRDRGYRVVLLEADALGCGQTLASQGMVHGGLKYALGGKVTGASEAIADMPSRWRTCLGEIQHASGPGDVDLTGTPLLAERYYMFAGAGSIGRLTTFFASRALRGRIEKIAPTDWPRAFAGFDGTVYGLNDFVLDTHALLARLVAGGEDDVLALRLGADNVRTTETGYAIELEDATLHARRLISCAGVGSEALHRVLGIDDIPVQRRPLKQVVVRPRHDTRLYAHCLTGVRKNEPRLTITAHDSDRGLVWYLGGQIATEGVARSDDAQIDLAARELAACVPWLDWTGAEFDVLDVDRAEPKTDGGRRPDEAYVAASGDFIQCFPTKLSLAPDLADKVLRLLDQGSAGARTDPVTAASRHPRATVGSAPW